jgi:hypothetical protein
MTQDREKKRIPCRQWMAEGDLAPLNTLGMLVRIEKAFTALGAPAMIQL